MGDEESFPFPFLFCFFLFNLPAATYSVCLSFALSFFLVVAILGGKAKREQGGRPRTVRGRGGRWTGKKDCI